MGSPGLDACKGHRFALSVGWCGELGPDVLTALNSWRPWPAGDTAPATVDDGGTEDADHPQTDLRPRSVFLWLPLALASGIWIYFGLPREPASWTAWLLIVIASLLLWRGRHRGTVVLLAVVLAGFAVAKLRTDWVATPLITQRSAELMVIGSIEQVANRSPTRRDVVLAVETIETLTPAATPRRLRLTIFKGGDAVAVGNRVSLKARLAPLPGPAMPGGFDYGRQLYFGGIGGTGRSNGEAELLARSSTPMLVFLRALDGLRGSINQRITASLPPEEATVAAALITGDRAQISRETNTSLQVSGLAHILSISGLHMSLAAGGIFWLARALLALSPRLALNYPIKKWAAVAALGGGFIYMLLAGSGSATQRSYIMVAIMLFAILVDRTAISLRNLAVAAIIILLLQPESAVEASFQMSFMAVMGLAAFFEWWNSRLRETENIYRSWPTRILRWLALAVLASLLTSVIAGSLSSIPAAYHFGRAAPYGVLANGLAIPIVSIIVMPSALAALIAMPFGLERWPLEFMGFGLNRVLAISDWVASLPGSALVLPQVSATATFLLAAAATVLCLAPRRAKLWSIALLLAGLIATRMTSSPDLLVERTGANVALRSEDGALAFAVARRGSFAAGRWLQANGEQASLAAAAKRPGWTCQSGICRAEAKGKHIVYLSQENAILPDCATIDILISSTPLRGRCRSVGVRIDRFDVWRHGSHAVQINGSQVSVITASQHSGERPWVTVPTARAKRTP